MAQNPEALQALIIEGGALISGIAFELVSWQTPAYSDRGRAACIMVAAGSMEIASKVTQCTDAVIP